MPKAARLLSVSAAASAATSRMASTASAAVMSSAGGAAYLMRGGVFPDIYVVFLGEACSVVVKIRAGGNRSSLLVSRRMSAYHCERYKKRDYYCNNLPHAKMAANAGAVI